MAGPHNLWLSSSLPLRATSFWPNVFEHQALDSDILGSDVEAAVSTCILRGDWLSPHWILAHFILRIRMLTEKNHFFFRAPTPFVFNRPALTHFIAVLTLRVSLCSGQRDEFFVLVAFLGLFPGCV